MVHIKKLNEMIGDKYYLYKGYHEAYISDRPVAGTTNNRPNEYRTFNDAYEAAEKLGVDILYSDGLRDEVCDFFGDRNYYDENPELFFNPDEPIRESRRANTRGRTVNEMYFGDKISDTPYVLNDKETKKVKDIVSRMGETETKLRELLNDLQMALPIGYKAFEFDGDVITMDCIKKWETILSEEIDKFCYYV